MSSKNYVEVIECTGCGAVHDVEFKFSEFFAANQEYESDQCEGCGRTIARRKCLSVTATMRKSEVV